MNTEIKTVDVNYYYKDSPSEIFQGTIAIIKDLHSIETELHELDDEILYWVESMEELEELKTEGNIDFKITEIL